MDLLSSSLGNIQCIDMLHVCHFLCHVLVNRVIYINGPDQLQPYTSSGRKPRTDLVEYIWYLHQNRHPEASPTGWYVKVSGRQSSILTAASRLAQGCIKTGRLDTWLLPSTFMTTTCINVSPSHGGSCFCWFVGTIVLLDLLRSWTDGKHLL